MALDPTEAADSSKTTDPAIHHHPTMQLDLVTLGVPDLDAARDFYATGLGWEIALDVPGEVVFLHAGHSRLLGLWIADEMAQDVGTPPPSLPGQGVTLSQVVQTESEVTETLDRAVQAGGTVLKQPQYAAFGGFHGYFADPCGFAWEIATNPGWHVEPDGRVRIGKID
jgi:catechol 2,3-dioxygenase-like lactoylglutathione lyase family enzyme